MVLDSDSSQAQVGNVLRANAQSSQLKLSDLGRRVMKEGIACDPKTLTARRKRSEIRCFKLMATACDGAVGPLPKRPKGIPLNGLKKELKVVHNGAEEQGLDMSTLGKPGICQPEGAGSTGVMIGAVLEEGRCMEGSKHGLRNAGNVHGQDQMVDGDDKGGGEVQRWLRVPCSNPVSPEHCVVSICGRSREMEDAAIAVPSFLSLPSSSADRGGFLTTNVFHMYGVFDGHGGRQAAEICKERMPGILAEEMTATGDSSSLGWETCMQACFQRLDDELCGICPHGSECPRSASSTSSCREPIVPGSVGTTAVVAVVGADEIIVGNCGDSRAVLCRGGQAVPLSLDHKASRPDEVARIEAAGGCVFNWQGHRVCGVLAMSRALGDSYLKPYVSGLPEVTVTVRSDDDECLILASDGLWDVLSNELVCNVARKVLAGWHKRHTNFQHRYPLFTHDPKERISDQQQFNFGNEDAEDSPSQVVAALLTKLALAKQSKDNISVVVVDLRRV